MRRPMRPQLQPDPVTYWPPLGQEVQAVFRRTMSRMGLLHPTAHQKSFLFSVCHDVETLFLLLCPSLRFGRHPVLIVSVMFMLVFGLSVAFSVNITMFSTLRFFEGFSLAGLALSLYVLSKFTTPSHFTSAEGSPLLHTHFPVQARGGQKYWNPSVSK